MRIVFSVGSAWICLAAMVMSVCLGLWSAQAKAGKYAYGQDFVRVGRAWSDAGPLSATVQAEPTTAGQGLSDWAQQIAEMEVSGGPYSNALAEPLASLGRQYRRNGDLAEAMRLYRRALHVVRVNDGLYSERQVPILRELLDVYRVTGELSTLDNRYDYYFRLFGNGLPPYTDVRLQASLGYLRWQREAVRLGIDDEPGDRIRSLLRLNEDLLEAVADDSALDQRWYHDLAFSQLRNLYLLTDLYAPTIENRGVTTEMPMLGNEWDKENFNRRQLETMERGSVARGSRLMEEVIRRSAQAENEELARIYLEWGDWYQWHGEDRRAGEQYREVLRLLEEAGRDDLLQQWLGQPVELPDNGAFWQPREEAQALAEPVPVMRARYDVSARGRVRKLSATVSDPRFERKIGRTQRKLRQIRFRPRWINGEPEAVAQVQRDYEILD